jgi:hypothetical protein
MKEPGHVSRMRKILVGKRNESIRRYFFRRPWRRWDNIKIGFKMDYGLVNLSEVTEYRNTLNVVISFSRSQWPGGLRRRPWSFRRWYFGFESRWRHGCLFLYFCIMLSCVVRGPSDGWLVQRSSTKCLNRLRNLPFLTRPRTLQGL